MKSIELIWEVEYQGIQTLFKHYVDACESITKSFNWKEIPEFPVDNQLTNSTKIGKTTPEGGWIILKAKLLHTNKTLL